MNAVAERQTSLIALIDTSKDELSKTLQHGVTPDRFIRTVKNAIIANPGLADTDHRKLFAECQKAAADGLVLDGREAALVTFNARYKDKDGKWKSRKEVSYIPMVYGIKKRVRASGLIKTWTLAIVYANELEGGRFTYTQGDNPTLHHEPIIIGDRGEMVAVYSSVKFTDGTHDHELMNKQDVDRIMARTRSKKQDGTIMGPWRDDYEEMAKKTCAKRHAKNLPMDENEQQLLDRLNDLYDFKKNAAGEYEDQPDVAKKRDTVSAAARLEGPKEEAKPKPKAKAKAKPKTTKPAKEEEDETEVEVIDHDEETGEIIEHEDDSVNTDTF